MSKPSQHPHRGNDGNDIDRQLHSFRVSGRLLNSRPKRRLSTGNSQLLQLALVKGMNEGTNDG